MRVPFERADDARTTRVTSEFDVLVVGGGITGVGVALDAVTRGLRTALVERDDFASGTSSKSSKLVHGGLRYLQQGDIRLVYQALHERQRLLRNAPHLVAVLPFLDAGPHQGRAGLEEDRQGDALGAVDVRPHRRRSDRQAATAGSTPTQSLAHCPTLPAERLSSGFVYYDAATDDARLDVDDRPHGGAARRGGRQPLRGGRADHGPRRPRRRRRRRHRRGDDRRRAPTSSVSATGVWADELRRLDEACPPRLDPARQGRAHHDAVAAGRQRHRRDHLGPGDKRSLFLVPWGELPDGTFEHCYVGTTDTDFDGRLDDPQTDDDDLEYVLRRPQPRARPPRSHRDDITGVWAGLRPLVEGADSVAHRRPVAASPGSASAMPASSPSPAASSRRTARWRPTPSTSSCARSAGASQLATKRLRAARRRRASGTSAGRCIPTPTCSSRYGSEAAEVKALIALDRRSPSRWCPACSTCRPRPCTPCGARWRPRSTTCCCAARGPTSTTAPRAWPPPPTSPICSARELGWSADERGPPGRRLPATVRCRGGRDAAATAGHRRGAMTRSPARSS